MKAFLLCSPSHRAMLETYLLPSLPEDLDLIVKGGAQHCESGEYMADGWMDCMREKVEMLISAVEDNPGECLLHLDADVQFFAPRIEPVLRRYLERADFVAQSDGENDQSDVFCGGFFAFRANQAVKMLFRTMLQFMEERNINDQDALNLAVRLPGLRLELLHPDHFWSPRKAWKPGAPLDLSPSAVAHHANWCVGVDRKMSQLEEGKRLQGLWRGLERHGSQYGGKWIRADTLNGDSIVYSAGTGEDISFDISLLDRYGAEIFAFDPTPRAIDFAMEFARIDSRFHFHPFGISGRSEGLTTCYMPSNPDHVSWSIFDTGGTKSELPMRPVDRIVDALGHKRIDLFKMDIEGSEYEVLERMLETVPPILPRQLLVEFHDTRAPGLAARKANLIRRLLTAGYDMTYQEDRDYSFFLPTSDGGPS